MSCVILWDSLAMLGALLEKLFILMHPQVSTPGPMPSVTLYVFHHGVTQEPSIQESLNKYEMNKFIRRNFDLVLYFLSIALVTMTPGSVVHRPFYWMDFFMMRGRGKGRSFVMC